MHKIFFSQIVRTFDLIIFCCYDSIWVNPFFIPPQIYDLYGMRSRRTFFNSFSVFLEKHNPIFAKQRNLYWPEITFSAQLHSTFFLSSNIPKSITSTLFSNSLV